MILSNGLAGMKRNKPRKVPHNEVFRYYIVERDPHPGFRVFPCDFEEEQENEWI